jgi:hypothetical protein
LKGQKLSVRWGSLLERLVAKWARLERLHQDSDQKTATDDVLRAARRAASAVVHTPLTDLAYYRVAPNVVFSPVSR